MLRIELEPADFLAIRFVADVGPLDDVAGAARALREPRSPLLAEWRQAVLPRLSPEAATALTLQPPAGYGFDFTTPSEPTLAGGLEAVRSTPRRVLRYEADEFVTGNGTLPGLLRDLPDGGSGMLRAVADSLESLHGVAVAPVEERLRLIRAASVHRQAVIGARDGVAAMLDTIHPLIRLRGTTLEIRHWLDHTTRTGGEGLILCPSPWLRERVMVVDSPHALVKVWYPAGLPLVVGSPDASDPLSRLIGATRARLLSVLAHADGPGTLALADQLRISAATASEHLTVLRHAGLVSTRRDRSGARHRLTVTALQLLTSASVVAE